MSRDTMMLAWLMARAQAHREMARYYCTKYMYIKNNSNTITGEDADDLDQYDRLYLQHTDMCYALEDAVVALEKGLAADDIGQPYQPASARKPNGGRNE